MNTVDFLKDVFTIVAGRSERRFARDVLREIGFCIDEPKAEKRPIAAAPRPETKTP